MGEQATPKIAEWRGCPDSTSYEEAQEVFRLANLTKTDTFYDLGCGHGWVCIWASKYCKSAKGIEELEIRAGRARRNVAREGATNVKIVKGDIFRRPLSDADVIYCTLGLNVEDFEVLDADRRGKPLRIVTFGPPPPPILPAATSGSFCLIVFPAKHARTPAEWRHEIAGTPGEASWTDVRRKFKDMDNESLKMVRRKLVDCWKRESAG